MAKPLYDAQESYDSNSNQYAQSKELQFRRFETATFLELLKLAGIRDSDGRPPKTILDVACGDGFFTRMLPSNLIIAGVDISLKMVELARSKSPAEIKYIHYDGSKLNTPEFADVLQTTLSIRKVTFVQSAFFLHYATSKQELIQYLQSIYGVLEDGGVFFGINDNPNDDPGWFGKGEMKSIGYEKEFASAGDRRDGSEMFVSFYDQNKTKTMQISNYYFTDATYKEAFDVAGFVDFKWIGIQAIDYSMETEEVKKAMDLYYRVQPVLGFIAKKAL